MLQKNNIEAAYKLAREQYAKWGIDTDRVLDVLQDIEISMHCWQGDDFKGYDIGNEDLSGGIMTTGNYGGRAANVDELRRDYEKLFHSYRADKELFFMLSIWRHRDRR